MENHERYKSYILNSIRELGYNEKKFATLNFRTLFLVYRYMRHKTKINRI